MRHRAVLGSLSATEIVSWGVLIYAFSVFLVPMREELGWSDAALSGAYSLGIVVSGLAAVPVGRWLDRRGPRALMTAGSALTVLVLLAWSRVGSLAAFYLLFAVAGLAMAATLYEPAFATAAGWFAEGRARAVLVLTVFGGLASVVFVPLCGVLVEAYGWRDALLVLAGLVAVICLPLHRLLPRGGPPRAGAAPAVAERAAALRSRSFRLLAVCLTVTTAGRVAVSVHLVAYLVSRGYALGAATLMTGALGLWQVAGRACATALRSRLAEPVVYGGLFAVQGASVGLLLGTSGHGSGATAAVVAFVALYGFAFGIPELIRGVSVADYYGTAAYASINGVLGLFVTLARAAGPAAAGVAITAFGGYTAVLVAAAVAPLVGAAALVRADRATRA